MLTKKEKKRYAQNIILKVKQSFNQKDILSALDIRDL